MMLRSGSLHAVSRYENAAGSRVAITMIDKPGKGVLVWSGLLDIRAAEKSAGEIEAQDYTQRQTVSFSCWPDVWAYYESQPDIAPLLPELRSLAETRIASGVNASGPGP
ncbi:MAG: hypothetical protein ABIP56_09430 [Dokdonella sp.]